MRVAAVVQAVVLAALAVVVLSAAGLVDPGLADGAPWLIWIAVAVSAVSLVLNAITPQRRRAADLGAGGIVVLLASSLWSRSQGAAVQT